MRYIRAVWRGLGRLAWSVCISCQPLRILCQKPGPPLGSASLTFTSLERPGNESGTGSLKNPRNFFSCLALLAKSIEALRLIRSLATSAVGQERCQMLPIRVWNQHHRNRKALSSKAANYVYVLTLSKSRQNVSLIQYRNLPVQTEFFLREKVLSASGVSQTAKH